MLHYEHVALPEVAERSPAGLALGERVVLHPAPTGEVVEVLAGVHGLVQCSQDCTGHSNAWLCQTQAWVSCSKKREHH